MNRYAILVLLASMLPLVGGLINVTGAMIFSALSWALFVGCLLIGVEPSTQTLLLFQVPLLAFVSTVSIYFSKRNLATAERVDVSAGSDLFRQLQDKHKTLKTVVVEIEKDENRSLQIYSVAKGLAEALSWKDMAPRLTTGVQKLFGAYEFLLYAFDEEGNWTSLHRRGSWTQDPPVNNTVPTQVCFLNAPATSEVVPVLCVPVYTASSSEPHMSGILFLKSSAAEQNQEELLITAREFGEQLSMTLNKALLFSQMEMHSKMDGLTGVFRRQPFMDRLAEEFKRAAVFRTPFSVMMVDIDHFKRVNDLHGHAAGDAVLSRIGELLKGSVYETDVVGRYGGEEFIVLLPKAQADGVLRKAESLRRRIEQENIVSGFEKLKVTVSIGVAHFPTHAKTAVELIGQSDKALYQAKETGRNKVVEAGS